MSRTRPSLRAAIGGGLAGPSRGNARVSARERREVYWAWRRIHHEGAQGWRTRAMADRIEVKSHDQPDEVRTPEKTRIELVKVGPVTLGRLTFQPGWRWSECIK